MNKRLNPYAGLPRARFWRRSVSTVERHLLDPVVSTKFTIGKNQRVATAGSCFAQNIARKLQATGFNYFVAEQPPGLSPEQARTSGYGVFSARYGNIYTVRQLLQLYERAYGHLSPVEDYWLRPDGRFADPYRPNVEPDGFPTIEALQHDRSAHLARVRAMFEEMDFFVFTLGLTEAWRSRRDGAVFPLAPGVTAGEYDESLHEFVNFDVAETIADFRSFLSALRAINPQVRVLLTVSPVPLIATYQPMHVLTATTYSKSVLRVAADTLVRELDWVDYFPSFEIITGSFNAGAYYLTDARGVTDAGVAHVMRCFARHYLSDGSPLEPVDGAGVIESAAVVRSRSDSVCDEEAIDQISN
jgi:hypothetical protein